jgi:uncharacterized membrane protein
MPRVVVERVLRGAAADRVWMIARQLTDYPRFMEQVVSIEVCEVPGVSNATSWVVLLNGNELRWIEADDFDHYARRITFRQIDGDLAEWSGFFEARFEGDNLIGCYDVTFDLGVPALAEVLHPLGEIAIRANCLQMLEELERQCQVPQAVDV